MASFSIGHALGAGFRLIRRRPLAPLVWGLLYGLLIAVPALISIGLQWSALGSFGGSEEAFAQMWQAMLPMMMLQPFIVIASIVAQAMLYSAVFRAVLEPDNSRAFYLRLSKQELWVGLVRFCVGLLVAIPALTAICLFLLIGAIAYFAADGGAAAVPALVSVGVVGFVVAFGVCLWVYVRLSMAAPMAFHDRTFRLFESWTLTGGSAGRLMLLALLIYVMVMAIYIALAVILVLSLVALGGAIGWHGDDPDRNQLSAVIIGILGVVSLLSGYAWALTLAPWADAFQQLRASQGADPAPAPG